MPSLGDPKMSSHSCTEHFDGHQFDVEGDACRAAAVDDVPQVIRTVVGELAEVPLTWVPWPCRLNEPSSFQMKSRGATNRVAGPSSVAATNDRVSAPSEGYAVPLLPGGPTLPLASTVNALA